ncbi:MAG: dephospho-CoA kinase, partial [Gemmataceae bacterium]|nr:dephospho-CoA kinase [Gemmataceae bacterium]
IGAGKSAAARAFAALGATVIDADALGHEALRDPAVKAKLVSMFPGILDGSGEIDRRRLGAVVFADAEARKALESVSHPWIRERASRIMEGKPFVVLDAALLHEAGWDSLCDRVVFIDAPREERLQRVKERSGWTDEQLAARESAQLPLTEKRSRADHVVDNASTTDDLSRRIEELVRGWGRGGPDDR